MLTRWTAILCLVGLSATIATKIEWAQSAAGWTNLGVMYTTWLWGWDVALFCGLLAFSAVLEQKWRGAAWVTLPASIGVAFLSLINAFWLDGTGSQLALSVFTVGLGQSDQNLEIAVEKVGPLNIALFALFNAVLPIGVGALLGPLRSALRRRVVPRQRLAPLLFLGLAVAATVCMLASPRHASPAVRSAARNVHLSMLFELWQKSLETVAPGEKTVKLPVIKSRGPVAKATREHRDVVLVLLESANYLKSSFGDPEAARSPNLERLSKLGLFASSMRAVMPHSSKSLFSVHCGAFPDMRRAVVEAADNYPSNCLPRVLAGRGYATAFFQSANGAFEFRPRLIHRFGFEEYFPREMLHAERTTVINGDDFAMLEPGLEWMRKQRDLGKPFFATFFTSLQHVDYVFPPHMKKKRCTLAKKACEKQRYEEIYKEATDAFLGQLVEGIEEDGLMDNIVLVASGDHGEGLGEHGLYVHDNVYFEEGLHVPTAVVAPGLIPPGTLNSEHRSLIDIYPTILDLLGIEFDSRSIDGYSLLQNQPRDEKRYFRCWYDEYCHGYVQGNIKVVAVPQEDTYFRFDLRRDPQENEPVEEEPQWVTEIDELKAWMKARRDLVRVPEYHPKQLFDVWSCSEKRGRCSLRPNAYYESMKRRFEFGEHDGLWGTYFSDDAFGKVAMERLDPIVDFNWPAKTSPHKDVPAEKFSVQWDGCIEVFEGEILRLAAGADDSVEVWLDDRVHIDNSGIHTYKWGFASRSLPAGVHRIRIEYKQGNRDGQVTLGWLTDKEQPLPTVVPADRLMPPGDEPDSKCPPSQEAQAR
ncbi:MAG: sulfatase-like hydrolase/transferase [Myxococcota bacterium]|jgi:hypothetical protein|nr:sulfatase-like hydrolase/transferase [Myxococcota bacterium]